MYQNDPLKVLTGEVRLSYVNLVTPRAAQQGGEAKYFAGLIDDIPAADVAPVVHGRWLKTGYPFYYVKCSECERQSIIPHKYCPICGAKMDGGAEYAQTESDACQD